MPDKICGTYPNREAFLSRVLPLAGHSAPNGVSLVGFHRADTATALAPSRCRTFEACAMARIVKGQKSWHGILAHMVSSSPNNYAFIDSQNLNLGVQGLGWRLDFAKFRVYLRQRFRVKKAILFIGYIAANKKLYDFLEQAGYTLVYKPTITSQGETKGNVDAELVLHSAAIEYENYNQAIIVSGDGDFRCLIEFLIKREKLQRMIVPNIHKYSSLLTEFEKDITFLNGTRNKLERKQK